MWRALVITILAVGCSKDQPKGAPKPPAPAIDAAPATPPATAALTVAVDRRFETLALLQRLSGSAVYAARGLPYLDAVDAYFAPHKGHPAVTATAQMRASKGYNRDAVARLAVYLDDRLQAIRPLEPRPPGLDDPRFEGLDLDKYLTLVRDFAAASKLDEFFATHADHHAKVEQTMRTFAEARPLLAWFDGVFGAKPGATYRMVPGLLNYPHNYGVRAVREDGGEDVMLVMFLENADRTGAYRPADKTLELFAHELCHSYTNPIVDAHLDDLADTAKTIYAKVGPAMERQAYGDPRIVLEEAVVRAVSVMYLRDHSTPAHAAAALADQEAQAFLWTAKLVDAYAAVRAAHGGKLPESELIAATRDAIAAWATTAP